MAFIATSVVLHTTNVRKVLQKETVNVADGCPRMYKILFDAWYFLKKVIFVKTEMSFYSRDRKTSKI